MKFNSYSIKWGNGPDFPKNSLDGILLKDVVLGGVLKMELVSLGSFGVDILRKEKSL